MLNIAHLADAENKLSQRILKLKAFHVTIHGLQRLSVWTLPDGTYPHLENKWVQ